MDLAPLNFNISRFAFDFTRENFSLDENASTLNFYLLKTKRFSK